MHACNCDTVYTYGTLRMGTGTYERYRYINITSTVPLHHSTSTLEIEGTTVRTLSYVRSRVTIEVLSTVPRILYDRTNFYVR